ncbi:hypothetical protein SAY86_008742 [Trapa natans]|uniref:Uncharacterized protein n=1 Tax=Trapa natans TaxID=22666 RepID=A0AAN7KDE8_TRANT|nr:hypothetical protein SAY86_008742 [Trapa natans]
MGHHGGYMSDLLSYATAKHSPETLLLQRLQYAATDFKIRESIPVVGVQSIEREEGRDPMYCKRERDREREENEKLEQFYKKGLPFTPILQRLSLPLLFPLIHSLLFPLILSLFPLIAKKPIRVF